jgi:small subunit ribosomal protein S1
MEPEFVEVQPEEQATPETPEQEQEEEQNAPEMLEQDQEQELEEQEEGGLRPKTHFTGTVVKVGLAGALVDIGTEKPGLMHISQIVAPTDEPIKRVGDVLQVGQSIDVWVRRVKDDRVELTMVKPLGLDWRDIKKGMTVKGTVVRLEKFGAFVEIGAERPGLIHISEMAYGYVRQPSDVVKEGDEVESQVIDVNRKKRQIKLSMKALMPEPVKEEEPVREFVDAPRREKPQRAAKAPRKGKPSRRSDEFGGNVDELMAVMGQSESEGESETAMAVAWKEAMDKVKARKQSDKGRKGRGTTAEQEDILSRTLEHKATP